LFVCLCLSFVGCLFFVVVGMVRCLLLLLFVLFFVLFSPSLWDTHTHIYTHAYTCLQRRKFGCYPNPRLEDIIAENFHNIDQVDEAYRALEEMKQEGETIDIEMFNLIIVGCSYLRVRVFTEKQKEE